MPNYTAGPIESWGWQIARHNTRFDLYWACIIAKKCSWFFKVIILSITNQVIMGIINRLNHQQTIFKGRKKQILCKRAQTWFLPHLCVLHINISYFLCCSHRLGSIIYPRCLHSQSYKTSTNLTVVEYNFLGSCSKITRVYCTHLFKRYDLLRWSPTIH